jgi:UDPglucose--hexose-1-phosphate uridylyltransferase
MSNEKSIPLSHGIVRQDRKLADGRTISYYDSKATTRNATDSRPVEKRPGLGELRLDALTNEWVVMAAHRQTRVFLPPKELCPLCPTLLNSFNTFITFQPFWSKFPKNRPERKCHL